MPISYMLVIVFPMTHINWCHVIPLL